MAKRNALLAFTETPWGLLALAGVIFVLLLRLLAPNMFWYVFTPVFQAGDSLAQKSHFTFSGFGDAAALTLQNEKLKNENQDLANENQALIAKEASILALFGSSAIERGNASGVLAGVIARPPESPYDTLVIAAGSSMGVTLGMEAFGTGGVPIGVVSLVLRDFSRVTLFSAPSMVVHGWVGHSNIPLMIEGKGAGAMTASLSRSVGIAVGDTVFAPGPGALPIGTITNVDSDPTAPEVLLHITPTVNLFSATWIVVRDTGAALIQASLSATSTMP